MNQNFWFSFIFDSLENFIWALSFIIGDVGYFIGLLSNLGKWQSYFFHVWVVRFERFPPRRAPGSLHLELFSPSHPHTSGAEQCSTHLYLDTTSGPVPCARTRCTVGVLDVIGPLGWLVNINCTWKWLLATKPCWLRPQLCCPSTDTQKCPPSAWSGSCDGRSVEVRTDSDRNWYG